MPEADARLTDLEVKIAFQDHLIAQLDEIIRGLRDEVDDLKRDLVELKHQVEAGQPEPEDAVPPHY